MKTFKSLADLPKDTLIREIEARMPPKEWVDWAPRDMTREIMTQATQTLNLWLEARFADLVRERVDLEDVQVVHHGNRTSIRVRGAERFEFKMKITMGGT